MTWIAISDGRRTLRAPADTEDGILATGTLMTEVQFQASGPTRQTVLEMYRDVGWVRTFRLSLGAKGDMLIEHRQGDTITHGLVKFEVPEDDVTLRLRVSWHAPERVGLMSVENLETGDSSVSVFEGPNTWPMDDISTLVRRGDGCSVDPSVTLLACSDKVEPNSPTTGFAAGTPILTQNGPKLVEQLQPNDVVQTSDHGMQPIRGITTFDVPALGHFTPVTLRAPFFGLKQDIRVAPSHRMLVEGADAEYLFGIDTVLVEARHLASMAGSRNRRTSCTIRYAQVLLDAHVCLAVSGAWGESLYAGRIADTPLRHATSTMAKFKAQTLPRHTRTACPHLKGYEAMVLVSALCA